MLPAKARFLVFDRFPSWVLGLKIDIWICAEGRPSRSFPLLRVPWIREILGRVGGGGGVLLHFAVLSVIFDALMASQTFVQRKGYPKMSCVIMHTCTRRMLERHTIPLFFIMLKERDTRRTSPVLYYTGRAELQRTLHLHVSHFPVKTLEVVHQLPAHLCHLSYYSKLSLLIQTRIYG